MLIITTVKNKNIWHLHSAKLLILNTLVFIQKSILGLEFLKRKKGGHYYNKA